MDDATPKLTPSSEPAQKLRRTLGPQPPVPLTSLSSERQSGREELRRWKRVKTMWPRMQRMTSPASGQFWVIGGNPGNYKTQTMWNLALDMAACGQRILFVSLEIEPWSMSLKAVSRYTRIPLDRLKAAETEDPEYLCTAEMEAVQKAEERLQSLEFLVRMHGAKHGRTTKDVIASACRGTFDAIFVDHLGMMARQAQSELDEIPRAVDAFRALAHGEIRAGYAPLVCLASPLKRVDDSDDDRLPQMSDLRGSQRIESDADVVMILQKRPTKEDSNGPDTVEGYVVKNRDGRCPVVLIFDADGSTCTVTERHHDPVPPSDADEPDEDWRNR